MAAAKSVSANQAVAVWLGRDFVTLNAALLDFEKTNPEQCNPIDLTPEGWIAFWFEFSAGFPGSTEQKDDEGIEVYGREEGLHFRARCGWNAGGGCLPLFERLMTDAVDRSPEEIILILAVSIAKRFHRSNPI